MKYILFFIVSAGLLTACGEPHFLKDAAYRDQVHQQFEKRKLLAAKRSDALFSVFDRPLTLEQREALEFLYAYMPLNDLADYDGDFFLQQVNDAFRARRTFSWGKTIPDEIFRHFVLVYRVNNEDLDSARSVFFDELKDRVRHLSMYDAALEVNHWCHEKVTYRATDSRTSAPLALAKTSWGRCGEESTFTATAMRAVGIPARQCYTPRWAHTDNNHAWVEVWIDGQWHYLGACEPEAALDVAWFSAPAKRTMMVHTNVFGLYNGPEEKNVEKPLYSKINSLPNYADTRIVKVLVTDPNNQPVKEARVKFKLYNYADYYPLSTNLTDENGETSILSGKGDLLIWANLGDTYGYAQSTPEDTLTIVRLDHEIGTTYHETLSLNVPKEQAIKELSAEKIAENAARLAREDSIRNAYMHTFIQEETAKTWAKSLSIDENQAWTFLQKAQGNWQDIQAFIQNHSRQPEVFTFLKSLREKDLRDTPTAVLESYFQPDSISGDIAYLLSPRIEREMIRQRVDLPDCASVEEVINYITQNIQIDKEENYYDCRISPRGVYELGVADPISRNIFFVAMCRSNGIPARIEPATGKPQYRENQQWRDVVFDTQTAQTVDRPKARLTVHNAPENIVKPGYESHYSLAYFKDGDFQCLELEGNPAVRRFPYSLDLDTGYYRLTVGSRANDGSVTAYNEYFTLKKSVPHTITVRLPEIKDKLFVQGIVDMNTIVLLPNGDKTTLKNLAKGKGLMLCFVDPGKEPSKHILQDLPAVSSSLEQWDGGVVMMIPDDKISPAFDASVFKQLPQQTLWLTDTGRTLLKDVVGALQTSFSDNFPVTVYLSNNGGILYSAIGYRIGTGEAIWKIIRMEKQ